MGAPCTASRLRSEDSWQGNHVNPINFDTRANCGTDSSRQLRERGKVSPEHQMPKCCTRQHHHLHCTILHHAITISCGDVKTRALYFARHTVF